MRSAGRLDFKEIVFYILSKRFSIHPGLFCDILVAFNIFQYWNFEQNIQYYNNQIYILSVFYYQA